jgi:hypothetical protein
MSNNNQALIKGLIFIGLLVSVVATFLTGAGLEGSLEGDGGNAGALLESGEGSAGLHGIFAGLIVLLLLLHLIVNRKSMVLTLKNMVRNK